MTLGKAVFGRNKKWGEEFFSKKKIGGLRLFFNPKKGGEDFFSEKITGAKTFFSTKKGGEDFLFRQIHKKRPLGVSHQFYVKIGLRNMYYVPCFIKMLNF